MEAGQNVSMTARVANAGLIGNKPEVTEVRGDQRFVLSLGHPVEQLVNADFFFFKTLFSIIGLRKTTQQTHVGGWGRGEIYVAFRKDNVYQSHTI